MLYNMCCSESRPRCLGRLADGAQAAASLFGQFPGRWTVPQQLTNPAATAFWRKAIRCPFQEHEQGAEVAQSFTAGARSDIQLARSLSRKSGKFCDGPDGDQARARLRGERVILPELAELEGASVQRRQLAAGAVDARRAGLALDDLAALPAQRAPHRPLLARCWELRDNLTIYDAAYVALTG